MKIPSLTTAIAVWGAITGTGALIISYLNYKRDRANIKLEFEKDRELVGPTVELQGYKKNTSYICLSVLNRGRRPVTISKGYLAFLREDGGYIFADSMIKGSHELNEGKRIDFLTEQDGIDFSNISHFEAYDTVGNVYRKNYAPWPTRFFYWFLDKSQLRKKPLATEIHNG